MRISFRDISTRRWLVVAVFVMVSGLSLWLWRMNGTQLQPRYAVGGTIDLSSANLKSSTIALDGEWRFLWERFDSILPARDSQAVLITVPGVWNGVPYHGQKLPAHGYGTYDLKVVFAPGQHGETLALYIPFVHSSYSLFLDGEKVVSDGVVSNAKASFTPGLHTMLVPVKAGHDTMTITMQVANFAYAMGGIWQSPRIGERTTIQAHYDRQLAFDLFIFGGLLIMSIYHFALYSMRRRARSNLFFALLCFFLAIKNLFSGVAFFYTLWPDASYEVGLKLIHISIFGASASLWFFLKDLFNDEFPAWASKVQITGSVLGMIATILFTSATYSQLMIAYWVMVVVMMILILRGIYLAVAREREGALLILAGTVCFLLTVVHDLAIDFKFIHDVYLSGAGFFVFVFSQALLLAVKFTNSFRKVEHLTQDIMNTNRSYSRFVPSEFLSYLNKNKITEVELGDHLQGDMTVFFSDIRSYTSLSEKMTPKTNFAFINEYMGRVVRFIEQEGGLVNQYLGDGILALFMGDPANAVKAAISIQRDVSAITELGGYRLKSTLKNGIGIHSGPLILGMMGTAQRMSTGVISDTVNTASRIEGLTKYFGAQIIISESSLAEIKGNKDFQYRSLGKVQVKGKQDVLLIHEIFDGLPEDEQQLKIATRIEFETGLSRYFEKDFETARTYFQQVLDVNPHDRAAQIYLGNANHFLEEGVAEEWQGELKMEIK